MSGSLRQAYSHDLLPPVVFAAEGTHPPVGRQALHGRLDQRLEAVPAVVRLAARKHGHASDDVSVGVVLVLPVRALVQRSAVERQPEGRRGPFRRPRVDQGWGRPVPPRALDPSQEQEVGTKWKVKRSWRPSQARTLACLWAA